MNLTAALSVRNVTLSRWWFDPALRKFRFGALHGLGEFSDERIRLIALHNDEPGNGDFVKCMAAFETVADEAGIPVEVVEIWNGRLARWFERRGYSLGHDKELGRFARREARVVV